MEAMYTMFVAVFFIVTPFRMHFLRVLPQKCEPFFVLAGKVGVRLELSFQASFNGSLCSILLKPINCEIYDGALRHELAVCKPNRATTHYVSRLRVQKVLTDTLEI